MSHFRAQVRFPSAFALTRNSFAVGTSPGRSFSSRMAQFSHAGGVEVSLRGGEEIYSLVSLFQKYPHLRSPSFLFSVGRGPYGSSQFSMYWLHQMSAHCTRTVHWSRRSRDPRPPSAGEGGLPGDPAGGSFAGGVRGVHRRTPLGAPLPEARVCAIWLH